MEHRWNDTDRAKTEVLGGETCPIATLSTTNSEPRPLRVKSQVIIHDVTLSPYLTENIVCLRDKKPSANAVRGSKSLLIVRNT